MRIRPFLLAALLAVSTTTVACGSTEHAGGCGSRAIAWLGALTGQSRRPPFQNGAELAVHQYNQSHPDCSVGYIVFDSQGDPDIAVRLAETIVNDPQILAVVGPGFSGETKVAMPIFERAGLPVITASATNPTLSEQGWTTFHRVVGNDAAQGPAAAAFLALALRAKRVAIIDDGGLYGKTLADLVAADLGNRGVVVAPRGSVDAKGVDYRRTVQSIADIGVDAVYYGGVTEPAVRLLRQLRDADVAVPFIGGDGIFDSSLVSGVGAGSSGAYATCPCLDPGLTDTAPRQKFNAAYRAYFGEAPVGFSMEYADAVDLMLGAMDAGASTRKALNSWLSTVDFRGITKPIAFGDSGEVREGAIFVHQVREGRFVQVASVLNGRVSTS